eukprot:1146512-Pelagomonas_calceolata.AAC.3
MTPPVVITQAGRNSCSLYPLAAIQTQAYVGYPPKLIHHNNSNSFWNNPEVTLKQRTNLGKYRTGTIHTQKQGVRFTHLALPTAACAAIWFASIKLSLDAHTQPANKCSWQDTTLPLVSAVKYSAKVDTAHSLLPWTLAVEENSKNKGIEVPENISGNIPTRIFPLALAPLPNTKAFLMLSVLLVGELLGDSMQGRMRRDQPRRRMADDPPGRMADNPPGHPWLTTRQAIHG